MRKVPLAGAAAALVLAVAGVVSISAVSQAAEPSAAKSKTLTFTVVFSPFWQIPGPWALAPYIRMVRALGMHAVIYTPPEHMGRTSKGYFSGERVLGWDLLRGLCALTVASYHLLYWLKIVELPALGTYGVYMFFVLSGASLAYNYDAARLATPMPTA